MARTFNRRDAIKGSGALALTAFATPIRAQVTARSSASASTPSKSASKDTRPPNAGASQKLRSSVTRFTSGTIVCRHSARFASA